MSVLQEHLDHHFDRLGLMVQRYMRRFGDRLVGSGETYADVCVGREEMQRIMGLARREGGGQGWLDDLGVLPLDALEEAIVDKKASTMVWSRGQTSAEPLPLDAITARFGLSAFQADFLIAAAAPRLSVELARLYPVAWADFSIKQPTVGFLSELIDPGCGLISVSEALSESALAMRYLLWELRPHERWEPSTPWLHAVVVVPERIINALLGQLDPPYPGTTLHPLQEAHRPLIISTAILAEVEDAMCKTRPRFCLVAAEGSGRRSLLVELAAQREQPVLEVDLHDVMAGMETHPQRRRRFVEVLREGMLHQAILMLKLDRSTEALQTWFEAHRADLGALLEAYTNGVVFAATQAHQLPRSLVGRLPHYTLPPPASTHQRALWHRALGGLAGTTIKALSEPQIDTISDEMARRYQLTPGLIFGAAGGVSGALSAEYPTPKARSKAVFEGLDQWLRRQMVNQLGHLADPLVSMASFDDIVLTEEAREKLSEIFSHARHADKVYRQWGLGRYGLPGISILFSGPPGTGKTMTAGILANELGRPLYRVDLSRVVDKYIGETEKNLARIFDEAAQAQAILLFDEADSLFASRTEVKSSNDRYANLEVNFLLQRLETHDGISILTTNLAKSLDEAFQRRIKFHIEFPMPTVDLREALWRKLTPTDAMDPTEKRFEWAELARIFEFSGGHIRNAVVRAAFQAANANALISSEILFKAAYAEAREMGILIHGSEF